MAVVSGETEDCMAGMFKVTATGLAVGGGGGGGVGGGKMFGRTMSGEQIAS